MSDKLENDRRIRRLLRDDFIHYASKCLRIRTKSGIIEPFILNRAQRYIHEKIEAQLGQTGKVRALVLKGRQQGCSTYVGARYYHRTTHTKGLQTFILTHALDATANLYKMAQRYYQNTPLAVRPQVTTNNSKELIFGVLDSGYKIGTAENKAVGRSSTIQLFHGSEVAFWANAEEHAKGILQAIPDAPGTEVILESTANGVGNFFHQQWQKAEAGLSDYIAIFVPWFWQDEYRKAVDKEFTRTPEEIELSELYNLDYSQLAWRRMKIAALSVSGVDGEKAFKQEYPCNPNEAFQLTGEDSYIDSSIVAHVRKCKAEKYGPLIIGVDIARFGDDRTSIIRRQGRVVFGLESYSKKDTMEITGILHQIIEKEAPFKMMVDVGGVGGGVIDRLNELGHRNVVVPINSGSKPLDAQRYYNKRAEMWGLLKEWLQDEPCEIPDSDSLHADLCGLKYKVDSNSRLRIESKEEAKKRGVRSPDEADAMCFVGSTLIQTPKGQLRIDSLNVGDEVETPLGKTKIAKVWVSETNSLTTVKFSNGSTLCGKGEHKIFTWNTGKCRLDALLFTFKVETYSRIRNVKWQILKLLFIKGKNSEFKQLVDTINHTIGMSKSAFFIVAFGRIISASFRKVMLFITKITIGVTTIFPIWKLCRVESIQSFTCRNIIQIQKIEEKIENIWIKLFSKQKNGIHPKTESNGIENTENKLGRTESQMLYNAPFATKSSPDILKQNFAQKIADRKGVTQNKKHFLKNVLFVVKNFWQISIGKWNVVPNSVQTENVQDTRVYNLTLEKHNVYYANGILVFNCLTFALPPSMLQSNITREMQVTKRLASNLKTQLNAINRAGNYGQGSF